MKAVVYRKYGSPEVFTLSEVTKTTPKNNEILIKIHATTVTSGDPPRRRGEPMLSRLFFGLTKPKASMQILGSELAGIVEAVGNEVTGFKVGDAVFGLTGWNLGAYAEYICLPEDGLLAIKPEMMPMLEIAGVPFGATTALHFLRKANIQSGQKILIYGASGSVGTYAVQLAAHCFQADVTAVCSTANIEMVSSLGASHVIDYTQEDFLTQDETYDIIYDTVGKTTFARCKSALRQNGVYVAGSAMALSSMLQAVFQEMWTSRGGGKVVKGGVASPTREQLDFLSGCIKNGTIKPVIDRCYPLEEITEAHRYVETGHKKGNVVVNVAHNN